MAQPEAFVTSVHNNTDGTTRIDLRWSGNHEIGDFDVDRLGKVLSLDTDRDTKHTGWVLVEYPGKAKAGDTIPLRKELEGK